MTDGFAAVKSRSKHRRKQLKKHQTGEGSAASNAVLKQWGEGGGSAGCDRPPRLESSRVWQIQDRVDRLQDIIPFWRKNVYAAEQGEDMERLGDFLDKLHEEEQRWIWGSSEDNAGWGATGDDGGWGMRDGADWVGADQGNWDGADGAGWGTHDWIGREDPWAVGEVKQTEWNVAVDGAGERHSDKTARNSGSRSSGEMGGDDLSSFVSKVAHRERASPSRKRTMQQFYSVRALPFSLVVRETRLMVKYRCLRNRKSRRLRRS